MRREGRRPWGPVRSSRFPPLLFSIIFVGTLLASGVHMGLIVLMNTLRWSSLVQTILPMVYWAAVSVGLTLFSVQIIKNTYERPVQMLAEAAQKVANGDFSVFVPAVHSADKVDYLDAMIQDFNKMVAELGSIETLKTDFFSNVSHEIKTPLAVIHNSAALLNSSDLTPEQAEHTQTILRSTRRLADLIGNILRLNKLEKQTIQSIPEPYNLCEQLAECALLFESRWEEKDIEFEVDMEDTATIEADASLLALVWNNLLSNAIKFTEPGGGVTLRQTSTAEEIQVSVSDTGCGMTQETINHIFDKFYQGDTSHATEGNGLGLALVLRILRICGGSISVDSQPGQGSTCLVKLPVRSEPHE